MNSINILHITDIHLGYNFIYDKAKDLAYRISEQIEKSRRVVDVILVSGDVFDGRSHINQTDDLLIKEASELFETLLYRINKIQEKKLNLSNIIFLPGNHDLIREEKDTFTFFKKFLTKLHGSEKKLYLNYNKDHLYSYRIFKDEKIIILGLNSCKIEKAPFEELTWLNKVLLSPEKKDEIQNEYWKTREYKWFDYGYIELEQITDAIDELRSKVSNIDAYNIIVSFHHHIHPFPEIYGKTGDISLIKNFEPIIERLQTLGVRLVLHGHKHLPLIRPVANDRYLKDPSTLIYVVAGGNIGSKDLNERYFQMVEVYGKDEKYKVARIKRFQFKQEMAEEPIEILIPPKEIDESSKTRLLLDIIESDNPRLKKVYEELIYDRDNVSRSRNIDSVLLGIGNIITSFKNIKERLLDNTKEALSLMLFVHYRINSNYLNFEKSNGHTIKDDIKAFLVKFIELPNTQFTANLLEYLSLSNGEIRENIYDGLHDIDANSAEKRITAYAVIASYFTDLFQVISQYADFYYKRIEHKINIKLDEGKFHQEIPSNHIIITCESDRRSVVVSLKSKNPTAHKIAVLFIKDFELKLSKYEKDFDEVGLKTYYIVPKVEKDSLTYQLDDYNFEAYIPSLLPLLIGENIYSRKEVFIRELIQNSLDAILLREDIYRKNNQPISFDKRIEITFENEKHDKNRSQNDRKENVFTIQVRDNGIGMSQSLVERYFIHLGRSFYSSNEYRELVEKNQTTYKPISKFGIGFLTSFLICREIRVQTNHYSQSSNGLDIYIPNHEGCFFINKDDSFEIGTNVILYEDPSRKISVNEILQYINKNILDIQLEISIKVDSRLKLKRNEFIIESFSLRRQLFKDSAPNPTFFLPLDNNGVDSCSYRDFERIYKEPYGIIFKYHMAPKYIQYGNNVYQMNSGILLRDGSDLIDDMYENVVFEIHINFPPSYVDLDVSREEIKSFKLINNSTTFIDELFQKKIFDNLQIQIFDWLGSAKNIDQVSFFIKNRICAYSLYKKSSLAPFLNLIHVLKVEKTSKHLKFSFILYTKKAKPNEILLFYIKDGYQNINKVLALMDFPAQNLEFDTSALKKEIRDLFVFMFEKLQKRDSQDVPLFNDSDDYLNFILEKVYK